MSTEQNKAIVHRIYTEVNDGQRYEVLDELCRPDVTCARPDCGGTTRYRGVSWFVCVFSPGVW